MDLIGIITTSALLIKKVKGGLLFSILLTTLAGIPFDVTKFNGVFSTPPSIEPIFFKFEWAQIFTKEMAIVVQTFLFVDLFGTIGTIIGVANGSGGASRRFDDGQRSVFKIDFSDYSEAVPAFFCIIFMPLSYSISEGIVIGRLSYVFINLCCGRVKKISVCMCALAIFFILKSFL